MKVEFEALNRLDSKANSGCSGIDEETFYRCYQDDDYEILHNALVRLEGLEIENEELKKVIEILKSKPYILHFGLEKFTWNDSSKLYTYVYKYPESDEIDVYELTKTKYDLVKKYLDLINS